MMGGNLIINSPLKDDRSKLTRHLSEVKLDSADKSMNSNLGGIDLTPANMNLQTENSGSAINFRLDPVKLQQLKSVPGFMPVIINIQPMTDLRGFLGLADNQSSPQAASF